MTTTENPADLLVSLPTLSTIANVHDTILRRKLSGLKPTAGSRGALYRLGDALPLLCRRDPERKAGDLDPAQERARRDARQADLLELKLKELEREVVPASEAEESHNTLCRLVLAVLERHLPREAVDEIREEMARALRRLLEGDQPRD